MRVVFAGTPPFAARALEAILGAGHPVPLVLAPPDRPSGRGMKPKPGAVVALARQEGLPILQPATLKSREFLEALGSANPDVMVVAAYGLILPPAVLGLPARGCLNIHASLLPRWRGAAPVQRAILAGDAQTGVCIMQMDAGLDTGPVLLERRTAIKPSDTAGSLTDRLARLGAEAIIEALARLGELVARPQDARGVTYAAKIGKDEARIDWTMSNESIERQVRALDPSPGAGTTWNGLPLKIWEGITVPGKGAPGEVLPDSKDSLTIACGVGALSVRRVQQPGSRKMLVAEFLRGTPIPAGSILGIH